MFSSAVSEPKKLSDFRFGAKKKRKGAGFPALRNSKISDNRDREKKLLFERIITYTTLWLLFNQSNRISWNFNRGLLAASEKLHCLRNSTLTILRIFLEFSDSTPRFSPFNPTALIYFRIYIYLKTHTNFTSETFPSGTRKNASITPSQKKINNFNKKEKKYIYIFNI